MKYGEPPRSNLPCESDWPLEQLRNYARDNDLSFAECLARAIISFLVKHSASAAVVAILLLLTVIANADAILSIDGQPITISGSIPAGYISTSHEPTLIDHADGQSITGGEYLPFGFMQYDYVYSGPVATNALAPSPWSFELQDGGFGWLINVDGSPEPDYTVVGEVTGGFDLLEEVIDAPKFDAFGDLHGVPMNPDGFYQVTGMETVTNPNVVSAPEPATLAIISLVIMKRKL